MAQILVVEDEVALNNLIRKGLEAEGHTVRQAFDGPSSLKMVEESPPQLVILDWMLPGLDGLAVCRQLRQSHLMPIIMLTARAEEVDRVMGLEVGADDYVVKPFEIRELAARINAKLRRQRTSQSQVRPGRLKFPGLIVDVGRHEVLRDGQPVTLTPTEFDLLALLSASPGRVISRSEMIQKVWGQGADLDLRSVDAHVYRLRRKIEPTGPRPTYIHAVPGIGYRFERRGLNERLSRSVTGSDETGLAS